MQKSVLKVNIHCDGCKHKVKKILQKIDGTFIGTYLQKLYVRKKKIYLCFCRRILNQVNIMADRGVYDGDRCGTGEGDGVWECGPQRSHQEASEIREACTALGCFQIKQQPKPESPH